MQWRTPDALCKCSRLVQYGGMRKPHRGAGDAYGAWRDVLRAIIKRPVSSLRLINEKFTMQKEFAPLERLQHGSNAFVEQEIRKWIYEIDVFYNVSFRYTYIHTGILPK